MKFDPALAKRDMHAELTNHVRGLGVGDRVMMPDGTKVTATKTRGGGASRRVFEVHSPSQPPQRTTHPQASAAAQQALDHSAQAKTPESVGGTKQFKGYNQFISNRGTPPPDQIIPTKKSRRKSSRSRRSRSAPPRSTTPRSSAGLRSSGSAGGRSSSGSSRRRSSGGSRRRSSSAAPASSGSSSWDASKHPRASAGGPTGGQFIAKGDSGGSVSGIQAKVGAAQDGVYGSQTEKAVRNFQAAHGLRVDGVVGHQTTAALAGDSNASGVKAGSLNSSDKTKLQNL